MTAKSLGLLAPDGSEYVTLTDGAGNLATSGSGGGAATIADGASVTFGAKADAKSTATDTTAVTAMSVWKQISSSVQSLVTGTVLAAGSAIVGKFGIDQTTDGTTNRVAPPLSIPQTPLQVTFTPTAGTYTATWCKGGKLTFATGLASGTKISIEGFALAYNSNNQTASSSDTVMFFNADLATTIADGATPGWDATDTPKFVFARAIGQSLAQGTGATALITRETTSYNPFIATVDASGNIYVVVIATSTETVTSSTAGKATLFYKK